MLISFERIQILCLGTAKAPAPARNAHQTSPLEPNLCKHPRHSKKTVTMHKCLSLSPTFTTAENKHRRRSLLSDHFTSSKPFKFHSCTITVNLHLTTKDTTDGDHDCPSFRRSHGLKYGLIIQRRALNNIRKNGKETTLSVAIVAHRC